MNMAGRPGKAGIDFAGWRSDLFENDPKIDALLDGQGWDGFGIYFYLCCRAYASDGYFYRWGAANAPTTARRMGCGVTSGKVIETVNLCAQVGLFDVRLVGCGILTSRGIQRRWLAATEKRTRRIVIEEFWLLNDEESRGLIVVPENRISSPEMPISSPEIRQSKVKESKVKESKATTEDLCYEDSLRVPISQKRKTDLPSVGRSKEKTDRPTDDTVRKFGKELGAEAESVEAFLETMKGAGWRDPEGRPVGNWRAMLRKWTERRRRPAQPSAREEDEDYYDRLRAVIEEERRGTP